MATRPAPLRVVVLGDSLVWGQGLRNPDKFSTTALREIARRTGRRLIVERNLSRSGAQIAAGRDEAEGRAKRQAYVDTYPARFNSSKLRDDFIAGDDQVVTLLLSPEVPNTFPTIEFQVGLIDAATARGVDIVLLDGGANDIDFETYLNPFESQGNFIAAFDAEFRDVFYRRARGLIVAARQRFPKALLIYTGYFLPFAFNAENSAIRRFIEFEKNVNWFDRFLNGVFGVVDVPRVIAEVQVRAEHGLCRGLYWLRRTIAELSAELDHRGPGMLFVHPAFDARHVLFAQETLLHSEYRPDEVRDAAARLRRTQTPRIDSEGTMRSMVGRVKSGFSPRAAQIRALRQQLDGPAKLLELLARWEREVASVDLTTETVELLGDELQRINRAKRASFIHPNERGAERYSRAIVDRHDTLHRALRLNAARLGGDGSSARSDRTVGVKSSFAAYGIGGVASVRQLMQLSVIDSIAVGIDIASQSIPPEALFDDIVLEMSALLSWRLNLPYIAKELVDLSGRPTGKTFDLGRLVRQFVPGATEFLTLDGRGLRLFEIDRLVIRRRRSDVLANAASPPDSTEEAMAITGVRLELNGIKVFSTQQLQPLTRSRPVRLAFPAGRT